GVALKAAGKVDGQREAKGIEAALAVGGQDDAVDRADFNGLPRVAVPRLSKGAEVVLRGARNAVQRLGLRVVGLQTVVGNGPVPDRAGDSAAVMLARSEVVLARAEQGGPVEGRAPPEDAAHVQPPGGAVDPYRSVVVRPLLDQILLFVGNGA